MKKLLYIATVLAGAFCFTACDALLDVEPLSKLQPGQYFKSEAELRMFSMNLYSVFPSSSLYIENSDHYTQSTLSDEMRGKTRTVPASGGGWSWGDLRNANTILDNLDNCKDETSKQRYEALARFFRAYIYFDKVKRFGDVPWYDHQVDATDEVALSRPRDSREFILGKMIADIDYAIANLPSEKSVYEVTKWTALALKARFLLFEGTYRKYHAGDETLATLPSDAHDYKWYLDKAAEAASTLMTSNNYSLHQDGGPESAYYNLFTTNNATEVMDEVILARNYNLEYGVYHNASYTMNTASTGAPGMTKKLVASYLMDDGTRFTDKAGWQTMQFKAETKNRDKRLYQTIRCPKGSYPGYPGYYRLGDEKKTLTSPNLSCSVTGYHPVKYVTTKAQDAWNGSDNDLIIFRFGEVLLNYAEAKAEAGTLSQADLDISVNLLRDRVGMPHLTLAGLTVDPFLVNAAWGGYQSPVLLSDPNEAVILEIRRERAIELAQEGHRYYDVIRWKEGKVIENPFLGMYFPGAGSYDLDGDNKTDYTIKAEDVAKLLNADGFLYPAKKIDEEFGREWNESRDYLYPVPTNERSLTRGALTQNPGWDDTLSFD